MPLVNAHTVKNQTYSADGYQIHKHGACELVWAKVPLAWDHSPGSVALARQGLFES